MQSRVAVGDIYDRTSPARRILLTLDLGGDEGALGPSVQLDPLCQALLNSHEYQEAKYQPFWEYVHRVLRESQQGFSTEEIPEPLRNYFASPE